MEKNVFFIVGPTASGKTEICIAIAKEINAEIISADSRQIFKNITIASAAPSLDQRQSIKHHFIEKLDLDSEYNAGKYGEEVRSLISYMFDKKIQPMVTGGSGLYIKSLIDGFFGADIESSEIRKDLNNKLEEYGKEYLYEELKKIDPETANKMSPEFFRRVIRALEVYYCTGKKLSELQFNKVKIDFNPIQFGIFIERKVLYERINKRVEIMIENGLIEEVKKLMNNGYHYSTHNSLNTVGIKEVMMFFENKLSYEEMVSQIKQNSRRYAKRQMTWFNKDKRILWINSTNKSSENIAKEILLKINSK